MLPPSRHPAACRHSPSSSLRVSCACCRAHSDAAADKKRRWSGEGGVLVLVGILAAITLHLLVSRASEAPSVGILATWQPAQPPAAPLCVAGQLLLTARRWFGSKVQGGTAVGSATVDLSRKSELPLAPPAPAPPGDPLVGQLQQELAACSKELSATTVQTSVCQQEAAAYSHAASDNERQLAACRHGAGSLNEQLATCRNAAKTSADQLEACASASRDHERKVGACIGGEQQCREQLAAAGAEGERCVQQLAACRSTAQDGEQRLKAAVAEGQRCDGELSASASEAQGCKQQLRQAVVELREAEAAAASDAHTCKQQLSQAAVEVNAAEAPAAKAIAACAASAAVVCDIDAGAGAGSHSAGTEASPAWCTCDLCKVSDRKGRAVVCC